MGTASIGSIGGQSERRYTVIEELAKLANWRIGTRCASEYLGPVFRLRLLRANITGCG